MNISNLVNAPVRLATNCWQTACENKKTIAKVTAGITVVALAALLYSNRQTLMQIQERFASVANSIKGMENIGTGGGMSFGNNIISENQCPPLYTPYKLEVGLSKSAYNVTDLSEQLKGLYNNATSGGKDLFSSYGFYAGSNIVSGSDQVKATFLICRSGLSNLISAPWQK